MSDNNKDDIVMTRNQKRIKEQIQKEFKEDTLASEITTNIKKLLSDNNVEKQVFKDIFREAIDEFLNDKLKQSRLRGAPPLSDKKAQKDQEDSDSEECERRPKKQYKIQDLIQNLFEQSALPAQKGKPQQQIQLEFINMDDIVKSANRKRYNDYDSEEETDEEMETTETETASEITLGSQDTDDNDTKQDTKKKSKQVLFKEQQEKELKKKQKEKNRKENPYYKYYMPREIKYFETMDQKQQDMIIEQEKKFFNSADDIPFRFKILSSELDAQVKKVALKKIEHLSNLRPDNGEYAKLVNYIDQICDLPVGKYIVPHTQEVSDNPSKIKEYLTDTQVVLNKKIYGHSETKSQIVRLLAQWISNPKSHGQILGLQGKPGCGKTFLIKNVLSEIVGLPHIFIPVGGLTDASSLVGHNYTYEGSIPGMIVQQLMKVQCMNPIIIFDELDKVSESQHGKEIIGILTHLTDQTQNDNFHDKYFANIPFDLSRALMIFTYNDQELVDPILRDRITQINCKDYDTNDKLEIAQHHLIPELLKKYNIELNQETYKTVFDFISKDTIRNIISQTTQEYGVRQFKQNLDLVISSYNLERLINNDMTTITTEFTNSILSKKNVNKDDISYIGMYS